jgi:predicted small lipoprotein YifL
MPRVSIRSVCAAALVAAPLMLLAACGPTDPMYGPNAPKDAFGQPVHPVYGTPLPGTYSCCGGRD